MTRQKAEKEFARKLKAQRKRDRKAQRAKDKRKDMSEVLSHLWQPTTTKRS